MADKKRRNSAENLTGDEDENPPRQHRRLVRTPNISNEISPEVAGRIMSSPSPPKQRSKSFGDTSANTPPMAMRRIDAIEPDEDEITTSESSSTSSDPSTVKSALCSSAIRSTSSKVVSESGGSRGTGPSSESASVSIGTGSSTDATGSLSPLSPLEDLPMDEDGPPKTSKTKQKFFPPDDDKSSK